MASVPFSGLDEVPAYEMLPPGAPIVKIMDSAWAAMQKHTKRVISQQLRRFISVKKASRKTCLNHEVYRGNPDP
jgi:hypothetical protein